MICQNIKKKEKENATKMKIKKYEEKFKCK